MESSLVLIKPDGVQRNLIGKIISRLEQKGLKCTACKLIHINTQLAKAHYAIHKGKPFFDSLVKFITSGPSLAMVWEGEQAITNIRAIMGVTDPSAAELGTIRGDLASTIGRNLVHGSDSKENAKKEIKLFFNKSEIIKYKVTIEPWIIESE